MAEELNDSGAVVVLSVIGLVFGLIGMLGSFIPCLGSLAFFVGVPAAMASGAAIVVAYSQRAKRNLAFAALTVSLIGVVISGLQFFSISAAAGAAAEELRQAQQR